MREILDQTSALATARRLLMEDPAKAVVLAQALLAANPDALESQLLLGAAWRRTGNLASAQAHLIPLADRHRGAWGLQFEAGATLSLMGQSSRALPYLSHASSLNPRSSLALHALGDQLSLLGQEDAAGKAFNQPLPGSIGDHALLDTVSRFFAGETASASAVLSRRFNLHMTEPMALCLLADAGLRVAHPSVIERFAEEHLDRWPALAPLRRRYAIALFLQHKSARALAQIDTVLTAAPNLQPLQALRAAVLGALNRYEEALAAYEKLLVTAPDTPALWLSYGHTLKTLGRQTECAEAYRRCLSLDPQFGEAYWSLANLKVLPFTPAEVSAMEAVIRGDGPSPDRRKHFCYALGKALEDQGDYARSFDCYREGAELAKVGAPFDAASHDGFIQRQIATLTQSFFDARRGYGSLEPDPIFVVGLPRSGSTLIEQVLSSHPQVEGLFELPELTSLARDIALDTARRGGAYPASLGALSPDTFKGLGQQYLKDTRLYRKTERPNFVDKYPGNFLQIGLIQLILPNAKIIDVRRDPMACCLSLYKQLFAEGQAYSYDLKALGFYYARYVVLMQHFDRVLPGRVHRIDYEALATDPEPQIRALLDHCDLDFNAACLSPHLIRRPVRTASSEQVRQPISGDKLDHWRRFERWLDPLRIALAQSV